MKHRTSNIEHRTSNGGKWSLLTSAATAVVLLCGCASAPLKGGKATTLSNPAQGIEQSVVQSDNPAAVSRQDQETVRVKTYTVPAGSRLESGGTNGASVLVAAPMPVTEREETRAKTELGAAQKDTAREIGAKLAVATRAEQSVPHIGNVELTTEHRGPFADPLEGVVQASADSSG